MIRRFVAATAAAVLLAGCSGNGHGNPNEWKLTVSGYGPVKLGDTLPEGYKFEGETECTGQVLLDNDGNKTVEVWTSENGQVNTVIATESVATEDGVKLGDTADAVTKAYPDAEERTLSEVQSLAVVKEAHVLLFELADGKVAAISAQPEASLHSVTAFECSE